MQNGEERFLGKLDVTTTRLLHAFLYTFFLFLRQFFLTRLTRRRRSTSPARFT